MTNFPRRQVERSFRKFNDIVADLFAAPVQTWGGIFSNMITHCETDPVMKIVTEPLRSNTTVDSEKWYATAMGSVEGMVGSGSVTLPYDDGERTALLYHILLDVEHGKIHVLDMGSLIFGCRTHSDMIGVFNQELVEKFTREVSYRLDEILEDIGEEPEVPRDAMLVFHHHDNSTTIHGNVQGGVVATGGSTVSGSSASFKSNDDLATAIASLSSLVGDISEHHAATAQTAIDGLIDALGGHRVMNEAEVKAAVAAIVNSSPTALDRLKSIAIKIGGSVLTSAVGHLIKIAIESYSS